MTSMDLIYRYDPFQPINRVPIGDAVTANQALVDGNGRFADIARRMQERTLGGAAGEPLVIPVCPVSLGLPLYSGVAQQQTPFALVLGCSDARVPIESVFDQTFNSLFVVRIAGNILGTECLGSVDYAVRHLSGSLKLIVVLGHSGCGAVTAAVDAYLSPTEFVDIAFTHALRSLVDRIQIAVRGASKALQQMGGPPAAGSASYRDKLVEAAVYLNAAVTAYDLSREIRSLGNTTLPIVYGVYDLATLRVRALPGAPANAAAPVPCFADAPRSADDFSVLGRQLAERLVEPGEVGASMEW